MNRIGVRPTGGTYIALVDVAVAAGDLRNAMAALQEMLAAGEQPQLPTMDGGGGGMGGGGAGGAGGGGGGGGGGCFASVIELCGKQGQLDAATQAFEWLQRMRLAPTAPSFAALIGACLACGQPRRALQAVQEMKAAGWVPSSNTYDALLLGCARHGEPVATLSSLLRQMQREGVPRAGGLYLQLVEALAASSRHPDAVEIMNLLALSPAALQPGAPAVLATLRAVQPAEGKAVNESMRRLLQLLQEALAAQTAPSVAASSFDAQQPLASAPSASAAPPLPPPPTLAMGLPPPPSRLSPEGIHPTQSSAPPGLLSAGLPPASSASGLSTAPLPPASSLLLQHPQFPPYQNAPAEPAALGSGGGGTAPPQPAPPATSAAAPPPPASPPAGFLDSNAADEDALLRLATLDGDDQALRESLVGTNLGL